MLFEDPLYSILILFLDLQYTYWSHWLNEIYIYIYIYIYIGKRQFIKQTKELQEFQGIAC